VSVPDVVPYLPGDLHPRKMSGLAGIDRIGPGGFCNVCQG
jgi:hypothetical protein